MGDDPKQIAMEARCYVSAGNIAVPANAAAAVKALTPFFERARADGYRAGVEAAAKVADRVSASVGMRRTPEGQQAISFCDEIADAIRALAPDAKTEKP